jgi:hypothetical protein
VVPIKSPDRPAPAKSKERADTESNAERNVRARDAPPRIESRPERDGIPKDQFGIILRDVDNLRIRRLNDYVAALVGHGLLRCAFQISGFLRLTAHELNRVGNIRRLVQIGIAQSGRPGEVLIHIREHGRELRQGLDARVPILFVNFGGELRALRIGVFLKESLSFDNLRGLGGAGENLRDKSIGVQRDRSDQVLQLLGR